MRVTHVTTVDGRGGAAIAATRLHQALLGAGVDSHLYALVSNDRNPRVHAFDYRLSLRQRVVRSVRSRLYALDYRQYRRAALGERNEFFSVDRCHLGAEVIRQLPTCDCVHLHWISGFLDYRLLCQDLLSHLPAVWTLHDMNPFTGGCHYTQDCTRFQQGCGRCPLFGGCHDNDASSRVFARKHAAMTGVPHDRLTVVGPSRWIADQARLSPILAGKAVRVIPHPIDTNVFVPASVTAPELAAIAARTQPVVLFIAHSAQLRRKGYRYLVQALEKAQLGRSTLLLSVGGSRPPSPSGVEHIHLTHIEEPGLLNQVYNLADVCVVPSEQEAFGMTAQEALAAGTPVIGFDTGGCADLIRHGENGLLVPTGDVGALAAAIRTLVRSPSTCTAMAANARAGVVADCAEGVVARAYLELYRGFNSLGPG